MATNNNQNSNSTADLTVVRVRAIYHEDTAYEGVPLSEALPPLEADKNATLIFLFNRNESKKISAIKNPIGIKK